MKMKKNHREYDDDEFLSEEEFEEVVSGAWNRKRVICQAILNEAKTPEQIMAVAVSIGERDYGDDELVLQVLSDYWAEDGGPLSTPLK
ncbi:hypothetical protein PG2029B_1710 [Bifidobacterium pseudolongum subsp. globosum]|uniref:Uncharacterized protein n=1 Tax=Bifidobacterium pseudolongum subsp. globosum TaxID=1690 RepID=A0A4Q5ACZ5_9BIFI|nr:hypothetical protein [Bifidobacterium pseudolongum]RYQ23577.1 hypothetical protein PG2032B_1710 [Bifidobacterium pseudolongum subsp. globosum]RYQ25218.1 hypothetical protein PG2029B_1710 [Bifidobacterium pseudolongum subsp. globosum]